jgi:valyl-tRNA synthetase
VVADLEALDCIERIENKTIQMPYGDRSGVVIEPWLTDQWYVNAGELAKDALAAVHDGRTRFVPATWEKTYFNWMENIQPWCVSRQLWWGHQIPAWHGPNGEIRVARTRPPECTEEAGWTQDPDVLDTWFSSGLWPFSTVGWPNDPAALTTPSFSMAGSVWARPI